MDFQDRVSQSRSAGDIVSGSVAGAYAKLDNSYNAEDAFPTWNAGVADISTVGYVVLESYVKYDPENPFYEIPGFYEISNGYHLGSGDGEDVNQTSSVPCIINLNAYNVVSFGDGTESNRVKDDISRPEIKLGVRVNEEIEDYKKIVRSASITYSDRDWETTL